MKLCWDNIENVRLTRKGSFRDIVKGKYYILEICEECDEECFLRKGSKYCSQSCANRYISRNRIITKEIRNKISKTLINTYKLNNIPTYKTYAHQIEWCEEVRRNKEDPNVLEVKCFKCNKWYIPTRINMLNRLSHLNYNRKSTSHFYCSEECKNSCSIFGKTINTIMKEDAIRAGRLPWLELRREVQPELRQMVLERDKNMCVKCNDSSNLECHHIYPVSTNPLESADVDNCMILCKECHKKVHQEVDGCNYNQLHIEEC